MLTAVAYALQVGEQMKRMPGGSGNNPFAQLIEDAEGLDKIEALQVRLLKTVPVYDSWVHMHGYRLVVQAGSCFFQQHEVLVITAAVAFPLTNTDGGPSKRAMCSWVVLLWLHSAGAPE